MELNISKMHFLMHNIYSKMETGKWKFLYFFCRKLLPIKKIEYVWLVGMEHISIAIQKLLHCT